MRFAPPWLRSRRWRDRSPNDDVSGLVDWRLAVEIIAGDGLGGLAVRLGASRGAPNVVFSGVTE
jgi:hypothetical protein